MSDKSNAMTFAGDLWQRTFKTLRVEYPDVDSRHLYIDTLAMELVRDPRQFDVIVTNNLFGDIISDLAAQLAGGLGLAPSGNIHPGQTSLFEPVHGSAPNIAGKGIANPFGSVLASGMMLDFLGWHDESELLKQSVKSALLDRHPPPTSTDLNKHSKSPTGSLTTSPNIHDFLILSAPSISIPASQVEDLRVSRFLCAPGSPLFSRSAVGQPNGCRLPSPLLRHPTPPPAQSRIPRCAPTSHAAGSRRTQFPDPFRNCSTNQYPNTNSAGIGIRKHEEQHQHIRPRDTAPRTRPSPR